MQGIVNRRHAVLFLRTQPFPDDFWWNYLREPGNWLAMRPVRRIGSLGELLDTFAEQLDGVVIYSESVRATSNVASTVAGVERRLCLRYDASPSSVFSQVMAGGHSFAKNVCWLCKDNGDPLFEGKLGTAIPGTVIPGTVIPGTVIPGTVIPGTGSPGAASSGSAKCDAYLWAKYRYLDTGRTSDTDMAYYIDSYWLTKPTLSSPWNCTLVNHDYFISRGAFFLDLHAWGDETPVDDPAQPLGADLATLKSILRSMHYVRSKATAQDWFVAGDNGAGYLNPGMLGSPRLDPDVPDGWDAWTRHNMQYFSRYDLAATGFVIDGYAPGMGERGLAAYQRFSPYGLIGQKVPSPGLLDGLFPTIAMWMDLHGSPKEAGRTIAGLISRDNSSPQFLPIRTILKSPSWHKATMEAAIDASETKRIEFVDMYTFLELLKTHLQHKKVPL